MNIRERVARKLYAEMGRRDLLDFCIGSDFDRESDHHQAIFLDLAHYAIEAIPEMRFSTNAPGDYRVCLVEREGDFVWRIERVR